MCSSNPASNFLRKKNEDPRKDERERIRMIVLTNETVGRVPDSEIRQIGNNIVPELGGNRRSCTSPSYAGDNIDYDDSFGQLNDSELKGFIKVNGDVISEVSDDGSPKRGCRVIPGIA